MKSDDPVRVFCRSAANRLSFKLLVLKFAVLDAFHVKTQETDPVKSIPQSMSIANRINVVLRSLKYCFAVLRRLTIGSIKQPRSKLKYVATFDREPNSQDLKSLFSKPRPKTQKAEETWEVDALIDLVRHYGEIKNQASSPKPVFGFVSPFPADRRAAYLDDLVELILEHFKNPFERRQIRFLCIDENCSYVTLKLAHLIPNTVGIELGGCHANFNRRLAAYHRSNAAFVEMQVAELIEMESAAIELVDCVFLASGALELIELHGKANVQNFVHRLFLKTDFLFAEASNIGRDICGFPPFIDKGLLCRLTQSENSRIQMLQTSRCSVCLIERQLTTLASMEFRYQEVRYGHNINPLINRKYYLSETGFLKFFRLNQLHASESLEHEISSLSRLGNKNICPNLKMSSLSSTSGAVLMERIDHLPLLTALQFPPESINRYRIVCRIVHIAGVLSECTLYHNDFASHNFGFDADGDLKIFDFERSRSYATIDHFAYLAWTINDLYKVNAESYHIGVYRKLGIHRTATRAAIEHYPAILNLQDCDLPLAFLQDLMNCDDWDTFVRHWAVVLNTDEQADGQRLDRR